MKSRAYALLLPACLACALLGVPARGGFNMGLGSTAAKKGTALFNKAPNAEDANKSPAAFVPGAQAYTAVSTGSLTANWTAGGSPAGTTYTVEISTDGFGTLAASSQTANLSATFGGLGANRTYAAQVRASTGAYASLGSTVTLAETPAAGPLTALSSASVAASWSVGVNPSGTGYLVQLSSDAFSTLTASSHTLNASAVFNGLSPNTAYAARVEALNSAGTPTAFATLTSTTTPASTPLTASPGGTTIPPAAQIVDAQLNVWTISASSVIYENGATAGLSANVILLLYYGGVVYQENASGLWWSWTNGAWLQAAGDPRSTTPPTVAITAPAAGATVSGTVAVSGTAAAGSASLAGVQVSIDGGAYASAAGTTNWTYSLDTTALSNAAHTITAKATDSSGRTATTAPLSVTVSNGGTVTGYDGIVAVNGSGVMVNGHGSPIQLRGSNMPMDSQIMGGWPTQPFGAYAGAGGPPWATYATWKPNVIRITTNVGSWLNLNMGVLTGTPAAPSWTGAEVAGDPGLTYKAAILSMITAARQIGAYVIIDAHWSAPAYTFNGVKNYVGSFGQPLFMDDDTTNPFWTAPVGGGPTDATGNPSSGLVAWLMANARNPATGNINDIIFELFNEPFLDGQAVNANTASGGTGTSLTNEQVMLNGGWVSGFSNQYSGTGRGGTGMPNSLCGASGQPGVTNDAYTFNYWWHAFGYQQALNGIRALGATNVILVNGLTWSSDQSMISQVYPADTLSPPQVGTGWHIYESGSTGYPGTGDPGSGTSAAYQYGLKTIAGTGGIGHPIPIVVTETADQGGPSAPQPDPYMVNVHAWLDGQPAGSVGVTTWQWELPVSYGTTGTTAFQETILGAPITFTAGFSGSTMTVTAGSGIQPGLVLTAGAADRTVVASQLTGVAGGAGTYSVSIPQSAGSASVTGQMWLPINGQGLTDYDWMTAHP